MGRRGKLVIGSANLTEKYWRTEGQLLVSNDYDPNNANKDAESVFFEMSQFVIIIPRGYSDLLGPLK
jgi:hypothetical protein